MFQWLRSWLASWFVANPFDQYRPSQRAIYRYFDGEKVVAVDPMDISKAIAHVYVDLSTAMKVAGSPHSDALKMDDKALDIIRGIFKVKPFKDGGLMQDETYDLLLHFWDFEDKVKKNSRTPQTFAPATSPTTASTSSASPPTPNTTDSGCADAVPCTVPAPSSPVVVPSHSETTVPASNTTET